MTGEAPPRLDFVGTVEAEVAAPVVVGAAVPIGRMARPEDIAGLAAFLASADADYIVAQTCNIDGGTWRS